MKKIRFLIAPLALFLACSTVALASDWQYWSTWSAAHDVSDKAQVSIMAEGYYRNNMSDDYVYDEYITYSRKVSHGWGWLGQGYFESVRLSDGSWNGTRAAVAGPFYEARIPHVGRLNIQDRLFYRINSPGGWDYQRPRISLMREVGPVTLSLADEMRMDLSGDRADTFYRNRVFAMVSGKVTKSLLLGIGYVCQSDKVGEDWKSFNALQTLVTANF